MEINILILKLATANVTYPLILSPTSNIGTGALRIALMSASPMNPAKPVTSGMTHDAPAFAVPASASMGKSGTTTPAPASAAH